MNELDILAEEDCGVSGELGEAVDKHRHKSSTKVTGARMS